MEPNLIGAYGPWAASIASEPARLSFRRPEFAIDSIDAWRTRGRQRLRECLLAPETGGTPRAEVIHRFTRDGLSIEHLNWSLPYGPPTEAFLLKPATAKGPLPGVLALHDHGGNKYFGALKIVRIGADDQVHPMLLKHQERYYGGVAWANELARRGYAVLVSDAFAFASRRVRLGDLPARMRRDLKEPGANSESETEINAYNRFAAEHEAILAKGLFSAGTTWPGVFVSEDQRALDYLASRPDVDPDRLGCAGLSGGGLRTVYLGGLDERIRCACCVGMMTTWRDYLLEKSITHTWMVYIPGLPLDLDYPEVLGLRVPRPTLVLNNNEDTLFTLSEMKRADAMLSEVYRKAGSPGTYRASFHDGPHKFDRPMQEEAFAWFDRWLKA